MKRTEWAEEEKAVQLAQPISPPGMVSDEKPKDPKKCPWSKCQTDHPSELEYPNDGNVSRGGGLRGKLEEKKQQPWSGGGYGVSTKPIYLQNGKIKKATGGTDYKEYRVQAHHLIPIKQMSNTGTLKSNAELAGWDIDEIQNGMFLPADEMDMAIHELQQHEGSHCGKYTTPIKNKLRQIEKDFENACHGMNDVSVQVMLKFELDALAAQATNKILGARAGVAAQCWELHNKSLATFKKTLIEYARRKALNAAQT